MSKKSKTDRVEYFGPVGEAYVKYATAAVLRMAAPGLFPTPAELVAALSVARPAAAAAAPVAVVLPPRDRGAAVPRRAGVIGPSVVIGYGDRRRRGRGRLPE